MEDLVSIIITVRNDENSIKDCIFSVIGQTYRNIELIVIDDGSTDNSGKICDELLLANSKLKLYHQVQSGLAVSRNKGLEMASGKYVTFVNSSDKISNTLIENLVFMMNNYNIDISACKISESSTLDNSTGANVITFDVEDVLRQLLIGKTFVNTPYGKLFKRELFENVDFSTDDADTLYKLVEKSTSIGFMNVNQYFMTESEEFSFNAMLNKDLRLMKKYSELAIYCKFNIVKSIVDEFYNCISNNLPIIDEDRLYKMFLKIFNENETDIMPFFDNVRKAHIYLLANDFNNYRIVCPVLPEIQQ